MIPFSMLYENMPSILAKPELYAVKITHFSAGGLGACAYGQNITIAELVRCWQHQEYQTECPHCGKKRHKSTGEITNVVYQRQLTSLRKKIEALRVRHSCFANEHLSALLPGAFSRFGETKLISLDDVVDFMDGKMGMREGGCSVAD